uniref:Uncharacterized protein n=1 Tax=Lygus hesperus TaxID=30085 RepID=A0A146MBQ9_LYGHE
MQYTGESAEQILRFVLQDAEGMLQQNQSQLHSAMLRTFAHPLSTPLPCILLPVLRLLVWPSVTDTQVTSESHGRALGNALQTKGKAATKVALCGSAGGAGTSNLGVQNIDGTTTGDGGTTVPLTVLEPKVPTTPSGPADTVGGSSPAVATRATIATTAASQGGVGDGETVSTGNVRSYDSCTPVHSTTKKRGSKHITNKLDKPPKHTRKHTDTLDSIFSKI